MFGVGGFIFNYAFLFRPYNIPPHRSLANNALP